MAAHSHPSTGSGQGSRPGSGQARRLVDALRDIFRDRLRSVVAYGVDTAESLSCFGLVTTLTVADLEACAARAHGWRRDGIATPLLITEDEFRRSFDAFPLEYAEILRAHELLYGSDPFAAAAISRADLRRACETQIKSHLVHLREAFIESGATPRAVADLVTAAAPAFGALLRNVAQLNGCAATDRATATRDGARFAQLPEAVVADVLALDAPSAMKSTDAARLFPQYLAAVEQLARYIDAWNV